LCTTFSFIEENIGKSTVIIGMIHKDITNKFNLTDIFIEDKIPTSRVEANDRSTTLETLVNTAEKIRGNIKSIMFLNLLSKSKFNFTFILVKKHFIALD